MHCDLMRGKFTDAGVFGNFYVDGLPFSSSLEKLPLAIPAGDYVLTRYDSPEHGKIWRITKPGSPSFAEHYFEIHSANVHLQLKGCVALGHGFIDFDLSQIKDRSGNALGTGMMRGIANSDATIKRFMDMTAGQNLIPITIS